LDDWSGAIENTASEDRRHDRLKAMTNYLCANPDILAMVAEIKMALNRGDDWDALGLWEQLTDDERITLWVAPTYGGLFTTSERKRLKPETIGEAE